MRNARRRTLRIVFLGIIPLLLVISCGLNLALLARPQTVTVSDPASIEATVQARVDAILSDQPPAPAAAAEMPPANDALSQIVNSINGLIGQIFSILGLAGIGESISGVVASVWGAVSGLGFIAQLLCCCLLPIGVLAVLGAVSSVFGD